MVRPMFVAYMRTIIRWDVLGMARWELAIAPHGWDGYLDFLKGVLIVAANRRWPTTDADAVLQYARSVKAFANAIGVALDESDTHSVLLSALGVNINVDRVDAYAVTDIMVIAAGRLLQDENLSDQALSVVLVEAEFVAEQIKRIRDKPLPAKGVNAPVSRCAATWPSSCRRHSKYSGY